MPLKLSLFALSLLLALFLLGDASLLFLNRGFFLFELLSNALALGSPCFCVGSVFVVCLCSPRHLCRGCFLADICTSDFANALLDPVDIYELSNDIFSLVIDARAFQGAINECGRLPSVQSQKLLWVSLDFFLGYLEYRFRHLRLVVLLRVSDANIAVVVALKRTLAANLSHTCLRMES